MATSRSDHFHLPPELLFETIKYCSLQDLRSWTLVCKTLLELARGLLFRTITLPTLATCNYFLDPASQTTSITPHMRHLRLGNWRTPWQKGDWQVNCLADLLGVIRHVEAVSIAFCTINLDAASYWLNHSSYMQNPESIRRMSFKSCNFASMYTAHSLLATFPALKELALDAVRFLDNPDEGERDQLLEGLPLRSLDLAISNASAEKLLSPWISRSVRPGVTSLKFYYGWPFNITWCHSLFSAVGPGVTTLDIATVCHSIDGLADFMSLLPLFPALKVLHITYTFAIPPTTPMTRFSPPWRT